MSTFLTIFNILLDGGLATTKYFTSEAEALTYAYDHLNIKHDYEVQIIAQHVPAHHFQSTSRPSLRSGR